MTAAATAIIDFATCAYLTVQPTGAIGKGKGARREAGPYTIHPSLPTTRRESSAGSFERGKVNLANRAQGAQRDVGAHCQQKGGIRHTVPVLWEASISKVLDEVLAANGAYAAEFSDKARLPLPPARRFAILTCMDARLDPAKFAGLKEGDAHVIRNAGGRASDDAIRSLIISHKLLGTNECSSSITPTAAWRLSLTR